MLGAGGSYFIQIFLDCLHDFTVSVYDPGNFKDPIRATKQDKTQMQLA